MEGGREVMRSRRNGRWIIDVTAGILNSEWWVYADTYDLEIDGYISEEYCLKKTKRIRINNHGGFVKIDTYLFQEWNNGGWSCCWVVACGAEWWRNIAYETHISNNQEAICKDFFSIDRLELFSNSQFTIVLHRWVLNLFQKQSCITCDRDVVSFEWFLCTLCA